MKTNQELIKPEALLITDKIFNAIEWEKHYTAEERQKLNDIVDSIISQSLSLYQNHIREEVEGMKFMYEHHWPTTEGGSERVCENCGERVERGSPCKASPHYPCWEGLNRILDDVKEII